MDEATTDENQWKSPKMYNFNLLCFIAYIPCSIVVCEIAEIPHFYLATETLISPSAPPRRWNICALSGNKPHIFILVKLLSNVFEFFKA